MAERILTMQGQPVHLIGTPVAEGEKAPDFTVISQDMKPYNLSQDSGKVRVISVVPSLDTGVCQIQTREFNEQAANAGDLLVLTISMDLPFAQKRFCAAEGIDKVKVYSDFKDREFGEKYGFRIQENGLLARGVVVIDSDNIVRYVQYVPEVTDEPDYEKALQAAKELL